MSTCPFCSAETRPGDNFCLNCGNRLLPATPSPQQAQPIIGETTLPAADDWAKNAQGMGNIPSSSSGSWSDATALPTVAGTDVVQQPSFGGQGEPNRADVLATVTQATVETIEKPAKFILRTESESSQEYPLEKREISIGRAPNSDVLLSKDKLTSRRHATVRYENGNYILYDEHSANGTFVNGQQLEEMTPRILQDGDQIGVGEHELIFRRLMSPSTAGVEDLPTVAVPFEAAQELTYRTREDDFAAAQAKNDIGMKSMDNGASVVEQVDSSVVVPMSKEDSPVPLPESTMMAAPSGTTQVRPSPSISPSSVSDSSVSFSRLTSIPQPDLPDMAALIAVLATLDGQVKSLQDQLHATQDAIHNHEAEIAQVTGQLRAGLRRVSDRMDGTIADVARKREDIAWADLLQLMEDVENNPRDIEYVIKLARKARELKKVFQMHQIVLSTLAESNSLLRSLIGEDR